ncbi:hypothetical protein Tco_1315026 [Tanacetum coccineum]
MDRVCCVGVYDDDGGGGGGGIASCDPDMFRFVGWEMYNGFVVLLYSEFPHWLIPTLNQLDEKSTTQPYTNTTSPPHAVANHLKLPILKKGEYEIWAMKTEHYLSYTDCPIWEVIQKGNGHVSVSTDTNGVIKVLPPKTDEEILAREIERKARTTLLMALPEDHLENFKKMTDA